MKRLKEREREAALNVQMRSRMGHFDRNYRQGIQEHILSLSPERKKDFEYKLYQDIYITRRLYREYKERLADELAALAFLQECIYVIPFKKKEADAQEKASVDENVSEAAKKVRTA